MLKQPADLAREWKVSRRALRKLARAIGACRVLGKTMILTDEDQQALLEAMRCRSPSSSAGTCRIVWQEFDTAGSRDVHEPGMGGRKQ